MRHAPSLAMACLLFLGSCGDEGTKKEENGTPSLAGTYTRTAKIAGRTLDMIMKLDAPGGFQVDVVGVRSPAVTGRYGVAGKTLTFTDEGGPMACKGAEGTGTYTFELRVLELVLKPEKDPCEGRLAAMNGTWRKRGPAWRPARRSHGKVARAQMANFGQAINLYRLDNRKLPATLEELTDASANNPHPFMDEIPADPWGNPYEYRPLDRSKYEIRCTGEDGVPDTDDDIFWPPRD